jgi:hypothetical protein
MVYYETKFNLTKSQIEKIGSAIKGNTEVTLRLSKADMNRDGYNLPLTKAQVNKLIDGNVHDVKFSSAQLKFISNKINKLHVGGFLPLAALIPIVAAALGGVATVTGTVASRVQQSQADKETARHNRVLEEQLKKTGTGRSKGKGLRL